jgi:hypothetical protein
MTSPAPTPTSTPTPTPTPTPTMATSSAPPECTPQLPNTSGPPRYNLDQLLEKQQRFWPKVTYQIGQIFAGVDENMDLLMKALASLAPHGSEKFGRVLKQLEEMNHVLQQMGDLRQHAKVVEYARLYREANPISQRGSRAPSVSSPPPASTTTAPAAAASVIAPPAAPLIPQPAAPLIAPSTAPAIAPSTATLRVLKHPRGTPVIAITVSDHEDEPSDDDDGVESKTRQTNAKRRSSRSNQTTPSSSKRKRKSQPELPVESPENHTPAGVDPKSFPCGKKQCKKTDKSVKFQLCKILKKEDNRSNQGPEYLSHFAVSPRHTLSLSNNDHMLTRARPLSLWLCCRCCRDSPGSRCATGIGYSKQ